MAVITCPVCETANLPKRLNCTVCFVRLPQTQRDLLLLLTFREPPGQRRLRPDGRLTLGRDPEFSEVAALLPHPNVSRRHAVIDLGRSGDARVTDLDSTNGTFVNDSRVASSRPHCLSGGDIIRLGATASLTIEFAGGTT
jgi:pSer/pThr/pTyr-binding forkhead associated (FHA) protein